MCLAESLQDNLIEDEVMTDSDQTSFQEMMDEISTKADESNKEPKKTCPFAKGGMGPLGTMGMLGMGGIGALSGMAMPPMAGMLPPDLDPAEFSLTLLKILNALKERIKQALNEQNLGVCPQIKPINIFLSPTPYLAYQDVLPENEGEDAMMKIGYLQSDLKNYLGFN